MKNTNEVTGYKINMEWCLYEKYNDKKNPGFHGASVNTELTCQKASARDNKIHHIISTYMKICLTTP